MQLLGMRLVVFKDKATGDWSVLEDVCPHRSDNPCDAGLRCALF